MRLHQSYTEDKTKGIPISYLSLEVHKIQSNAVSGRHKISLIKKKNQCTINSTIMHYLFFFV